MIWFAIIRLSEAVHAGPLGFTTLLYEHVWADTEEAAQAAAVAWSATKGCKPVSASAAVALKQSLDDCTFPEAVIDAPAVAVKASFEARKFPEHMHKAARRSGLPL